MNWLWKGLKGDIDLEESVEWVKANIYFILGCLAVAGGIFGAYRYIQYKDRIAMEERGDLFYQAFININKKPKLSRRCLESIKEKVDFSEPIQGLVAVYLYSLDGEPRYTSSYFDDYINYHQYMNGGKLREDKNQEIGPFSKNLNEARTFYFIIKENYKSAVDYFQLFSAEENREDAFFFFRKSVLRALLKRSGSL